MESYRSPRRHEALAVHGKARADTLTASPTVWMTASGTPQTGAIGPWTTWWVSQEPTSSGRGEASKIQLPIRVVREPPHCVGRCHPFAQLDGTCANPA
jgi:hypothetical protein